MPDSAEPRPATGNRHLLEPDIYLPDLATSYAGLGDVLRQLGRHEDAFRFIEEAIKLLRQLAGRQPEAFMPKLAGSLANLSRIFNELGRPNEAFQAIDEAVRIYAPFFLRLPTAFARWMSVMVRDYRARAESVGKEPDEALLTPIAEALRSLSPDPGTGEATGNARDTNSAREGLD